MTEGQIEAIRQLRDIATASGGGLEIIEVTEPAAPERAAEAVVSLACDGYATTPDGLPLRPRERFRISIYPDFPLVRPDVNSTHNRFAGFPHVQWGSHLCLYQATDTEWNPSDGMFGFMTRLDEWLRAGAVNELDAVGLPLHPPVAYAVANTPMVVPRIDAPKVESAAWIGYAEITKKSEMRIELGRWFQYLDAVPDTALAGAVLLPGDMPFEYPTSVAKLRDVLGERGITPEMLILVLQLMVLRNGKDGPLFFVLGAAMRGVAGAAERLQHLACWQIDAERAALLWDMAMKAKEAAGNIAADEFEQWAQTARVAWCVVREERPEITIARDAGSAMAWWRGRRVLLLGCGAIGGAVAEMLVRAGAGRLVLVDKARVTPGILVRQNFIRDYIGYGKAVSLRARLIHIDPAANVEAKSVDLIRHLGPADLIEADVVIDATASPQVSIRFQS